MSDINDLRCRNSSRYYGDTSFRLSIIQRRESASDTVEYLKVKAWSQGSNEVADNEINVINILRLCLAVEQIAKSVQHL